MVLTAAGREAHRAANRLFEGAYQAFTRQLPEGPEPARQALEVVRRAAEGAIADATIADATIADATTPGRADTRA